MHVARFAKPARATRFACLVVAIVCAAGVDTAKGDEPLRWKFKVGEKLNYNMTQEMKMTFPQATTNMHQEMDMLWDVQGVNEKGDAVIRQKFEHIKLKAEGPVPIDYDSKSDTPPTGLAAMIAPMYKAMTEGEFEITMTARGEVKDVKIPEQVLTALKNTSGAASMGDMASPEGFKKMISQGALVLPKDAPKINDQWQTKVEMANPMLGKQILETTYRYAGTKTVNGTKFAVIHPSLKMSIESKPPDAGSGPKQPGSQQQVQAKVKEQSSEGEVLFNVKAGRLNSTELNQNVTIAATVAPQTIEMKIQQKISVKVTPADAKPNSGSEPKATSKPK